LKRGSSLLRLIHAREAGLVLVFFLAAGVGYTEGAVSASEDDLVLARQLWAEHDWEACLLECRRLESRSPDVEIIRTFRRAVEAEIEKEASSIPRSRWRWAGVPVRLLVWVYRRAIRPVLGDRCVLDPSCSEYALQAARECGWLGIPMMADRWVREASVIASGETRFQNDEGQIRYADPITAHVGGRSKSGVERGRQ